MGAALEEVGAARHALGHAVAGMEGVGGKGGRQLPEVVRLVNCAVEQSAGER